MVHARTEWVLFFFVVQFPGSKIMVLRTCLFLHRSLCLEAVQKLSLSYKHLFSLHCFAFKWSLLALCGILFWRVKKKRFRCYRSCSVVICANCVCLSRFREDISTEPLPYNFRTFSLTSFFCLMLLQTSIFTSILMHPGGALYNFI